MSTFAQEACSVLCIGMAGSGKTTFVQRLNSDLRTRKQEPFVINLDPAVINVPYEANLDIRKTVNYKEIMSQYKLGPNGAIITALNLFTTKFDTVLDTLQAAKQKHKHVIIDTPGQIEIFTWSASGSIITEAIATQMPTAIAYIIDTPRCGSPTTFMSNMLYACSIFYKTKLPMILVFNKTDQRSSKECIEWMNDVLLFQEAISKDESYMSSLTQSMSLVLEEFYKTLRVCSVSSFSGDGIKEFYECVEEAKVEFSTDYMAWIDEKMRSRKEIEQSFEKEQIEKLMKDLQVDPKKE